jgi:hypothetical protein
LHTAIDLLAIGGEKARAAPLHRAPPRPPVTPWARRRPRNRTTIPSSGCSEPARPAAARARVSARPRPPASPARVRALAAKGVRLAWKEDEIISSTKSTVEPRTISSDPSSTSSFAPSFSNTTSSASCSCVSSNLYWNPEQPPPSTLRRRYPSGCTLRIRCPGETPRRTRRQSVVVRCATVAWPPRFWDARSARMRPRQCNRALSWWGLSHLGAPRRNSDRLAVPGHVNHRCSPTHAAGCGLHARSQ